MSGTAIIAERDQTNVPISVQVDRDGGITGLTVVIRIYNGNDVTEFLDFNDGVFKSVGHTTPTLALTEVGLGLYAVDGGFDLSAITVPAAADSLLVQYDITAGGESGNATDTIELVASVLDLPTDVRDAILADATPFNGADIAAILVDTGTDIPARFDGVEGAGFVSATDSLAAAEAQRAAIEAAIADVSNVVRFSVTIPTLERPNTGSTVYRIRVNLEDTDGNPEDPDTNTISIHVENHLGVSRDVNLDAGTMTRLAAGRYESLYTISSSHTLEQLIFEFTYDENAITFTKDKSQTVIDSDVIGFTAADRTLLTDTAADAAELNDVKITPARAANLDDLDAPISGVPAAVDAALSGTHGAGSWEGDEATAVAALVAGVWSEALPGAYGAGEAGALLGALTAARAAALDEVTAARMGELDPGNMPADLDTLLARLTAGRAANLDEITGARLAELDPANMPADLDTLLTRLTATRATNLDLLPGISATMRATPDAPELERPETGSRDYVVTMNLADTAGNPEDPDANTINVSAEDENGTDLSANLSATTMTQVSTGRYEVTYNVPFTHTLSQVRFVFAYAENAVSFTRDLSRTVVAARTTSLEPPLEGSGIGPGVLP